MADRTDPATGEITTPNAMPAAVAKGIVQVMASVKQLGYDETNKFQSYQYVSIDKFLATMGPLLSKAGIFIVMDEDSVEVKGGGVPEDGKKATSWLSAKVRFTIFHESGAGYGPILRTVMVPANGAQAFGSFQSYLLKQFMRGLFFVATGDKDDPDAGDKHEIPAGAKPAPAKASAPMATQAASPRQDAQPGADNAEFPREFAKTARDAIRSQVAAADTVPFVDDILAANKDNLAKLEKFYPGTHATLMESVAARKKMLNESKGEIDP